MGLLGSFGYGVASLVVVSDKDERRRREGRSYPCFCISRAKTWRGSVNSDKDSYFEIWVWNASILVRVLVRSSNTFSWSTKKNIKLTQTIKHTPEPDAFSWYQPARPPQSCYHLRFSGSGVAPTWTPAKKKPKQTLKSSIKHVSQTVTVFIVSHWPCSASPSASGSQAWPPAVAPPLSHCWRWGHRGVLEDKSFPNISIKAATRPAGLSCSRVHTHVSPTP